MKTLPAGSHYEVVCSGGGTADTTLATLLARQRHRCLVLEQATFPCYTIGESLNPHTFGLFERPGFLSQLRGVCLDTVVSGLAVEALAGGEGGPPPRTT